MIHNKIQRGIQDGIPIAVGYFSVSFTFGMMAVQSGISPFHAVLISLLNLTSAGQFAGLTVIVINIRYALMSVSLSQKLVDSVKLRSRFLIAYGNTDEIFAVASSKPGTVGEKYLYGLIFLPVLGWVGGTLAGAVASTILPETIISALGVALYGMFIAIVVPPATEHREIRIVVILALILSAAFYYLPVLKQVSSGFMIIICTVVAAAIGAVLFPIKEEEI